MTDLDLYCIYKQAVAVVKLVIELPVSCQLEKFVLNMS